MSTVASPRTLSLTASDTSALILRPEAVAPDVVLVVPGPIAIVTVPLSDTRLLRPAVVGSSEVSWLVERAMVSVSRLLLIATVTLPTPGTVTKLFVPVSALPLMESTCGAPVPATFTLSAPFGYAAEGRNVPVTVEFAAAQFGALVLLEHCACDQT